MANFSVRVRGIREVQRTLNKMGKEGKKAIRRFMREELEIISTDAKRLTPVEFGPLKDSGHATPVRIVGGALVGSVVFGGAAASYAPFVHERLELHHDVGQAKFLTTAVQRRVRGMGTRLARELAKEMKKAEP